MAKIAILKIDGKTGAVKVTGTASNDSEALASIKDAGSYVFLEVHEVKAKKSATKTKDSE